MGGKGTDGKKGYKKRIIIVILLFTRATPDTAASKEITLECTMYINRLCFLVLMDMAKS